MLGTVLAPPEIFSWLRPCVEPRTSNNRVIAACNLYCCLLPHCEALRTCRLSDRNSSKGYSVASSSLDLSFASPKLSELQRRHVHWVRANFSRMGCQNHVSHLFDERVEQTPRHGDFVDLAPEQSFKTQKLKYETLEVGGVFFNPFPVQFCNLWAEHYLPKK